MEIPDDIIVRPYAGIPPFVHLFTLFVAPPPASGSYPICVFKDLQNSEATYEIMRRRSFGFRCTEFKISVGGVKTTFRDTNRLKPSKRRRPTSYISAF